MRWSGAYVVDCQLLKLCEMCLSSFVTCSTPWDPGSNQGGRNRTPLRSPWGAPRKQSELLLHNKMQATSRCNHAEYHRMTPRHNLNMQPVSHSWWLTTHKHGSQHCGYTLDPLANKTCYAQRTWTQWIWRSEWDRSELTCQGKFSTLSWKESASYLSLHRPADTLLTCAWLIMLHIYQVRLDLGFVHAPELDTELHWKSVRKQGACCRSAQTLAHKDVTVHCRGDQVLQKLPPIQLSAPCMNKVLTKCLLSKQAMQDSWHKSLDSRPLT